MKTEILPSGINGQTIAHLTNQKAVYSYLTNKPMPKQITSFKDIPEAQVRAYAIANGHSIDTVEEYYSVAQRIYRRDYGMKMKYADRIAHCEWVITKENRYLLNNDTTELNNLRQDWSRFLTDNGYPPMTAKEVLAILKEQQAP